MDFLAKFGVGVFPGWDIFVIGCFVVGAFLFGLVLGRNRILMLIVSTYITLAIFNAFPFGGYFRNKFNLSETSSTRVAIFLIIVILLFFLLSRSVFKKVIRGRSNRSWFQIFVFSILAVGFLVSVALSFFPEDALVTFAPFTQRIFVTKKAQFIWLLLPVLAMILARKRKKRAEEGYYYR